MDVSKEKMETINSNLRIPQEESGKININSAGAAHQNQKWEERAKIMIINGSEWGKTHPFQTSTAALVGGKHT